MTDIKAKANLEPEIDRELLEEAQRHLGYLWPNQVINEALLELVEDRRAHLGDGSGQHLGSRRRHPARAGAA